MFITHFWNSAVAYFNVYSAFCWVRIETLKHEPDLDVQVAQEFSIARHLCLISNV